ncbi:MAG: transposase [Thermoleophilia bacterium]
MSRPRSSPQGRRRSSLPRRRRVRALLSAAPIPSAPGQTSGRHGLHCGGNRQLNAALYRIAIVQQRHHPAAKTYLAARSLKARPPAKPAEPSNATSRTSSTAAC